MENGIPVKLKKTPRGVAEEVLMEFERACRNFPLHMVSAHEGFAILKEEVDELWDIVKMNPNKGRWTSPKANADERRGAMRAEAIQVAAMALL